MRDRSLIQYTIVSLTPSIRLAEVGEPPYVAQTHAEPQDGEEELEGAVPLIAVLLGLQGFIR